MSNASFISNLTETGINHC